jgi:hypothetical protein
LSIERCFSASYAEARTKFLAAAREARAAIETVAHPLRGPGGENLACDIARLGAASATRAIVSISATHGVEGHCGSGAQVATFAEGLYRDLPGDLQVIVIHAINPHGFAWSRRVNEDNVDLNRNFVDHTKPYPVNRGYEVLRDAICPAQWSEASRAASAAAIQAYAAQHGPMAMQQAVSGGQYGDPEGVFFGGHAPTWSNRLLRRVFAQTAESARHIGVIDYHTGLGPYGYGEIIAPYGGSDPAYQRAASWLGGNEVTSPSLGNSKSAELVGTNNYGMSEAARGAAVTMVALEFGVRPLDRTLDAVRADNWLHWHGDLDSDQGRAIKQEMRDVFYGAELKWQEMIVTRGFETTRKMIAGLLRR